MKLFKVDVFYITESGDSFVTNSITKIKDILTEELNYASFPKREIIEKAFNFLNLSSKELFHRVSNAPKKAYQVELPHCVLNIEIIEFVKGVDE